ncbi:MAG: hypothetical protein NT147_02165 [Candidatus Aminicenantes bacterium]|nr:hypothetical protein [Candidatus Aminicenantes bacterium]
MEHDPNIFRDSSQVIQEVEDQLERILQKKFHDVDAELVERITREKEGARRRKEQIEREFDKEKTALTDYRVMIRDFEEQRAGLLNEARDRFQKVLKFQAEIENLAKSTVNEIKRVNEIQERLEGLRTKTSERAAFLKNDLKERFGIVAEVMEEEPKPLILDLDEELEKLRKIKDLLAIESAAANLGRMGGEAACREDLDVMDSAADSAGVEIPKLQDLIAGPAAPDHETPAEAAPPVETAPEPAPEPVPGAREMDSEEALIAFLEDCRQTEPANGNGEIHYFQKGKVIIADPEKILAAVDRTMEEAQRLSLKLGQTESPKDQFFIKQELINWQEGLRALFLRIIKMCEKSSWSLPRYTQEILNSQILRRLLERLSMENWSNLEEFASFFAAMSEIRKTFQAKI